jgi:hypothetical protein
MEADEYIDIQQTLLNIIEELKDIKKEIDKLKEGVK